MEFSGDTITFDMMALGMKQYPQLLELLAYRCFLVAFDVKLPVFPSHTWLPDAHIYFAPVLAVLGIVNIVYGAFCAFGQTNLKRHLPYS